MIVAKNDKVEISGTLDDTMEESVVIVEAIKKAAWGIIDQEEDQETASELIKELSQWASEILDAVMPDMGGEKDEKID